MEATALSVGKSVLTGALSYAKSAVAEEVALQLGVRRDQVFITNELEIMQAFLMSAHEGRDEDKVVKVWVRQVRDVAYDVEDCLLDFAVHLEKQSWWRIARTLLDRRHVAKQMKELRANVEDVSQRNLRYNLIKGSKLSEQSAVITGATTTIMSGTDEARRQREEANLALVELISENNKDRRLRVISVWGEGCTGDFAQASAVRRAYDYVKIQGRFKCQAFSQIEPVDDLTLTQFMQDVVQQFYTNSLRRAGEPGEEEAPLRSQLLKMMGMTKKDDLARELEVFLDKRSYLIVLDGISTIDEWERVKPCFPDNQRGSRVLVSAQQVGVASLCVGADNGAPDYKHLFAYQTLHVFYKKSSRHGKDPIEAASSSSNTWSTEALHPWSNLMGPSLVGIDGFNRRDACTFACCAVLPCIIRDLNHGGVMLPRGCRKLKALHTLRDVDLLSGADGILDEIAILTGLRKLGLIRVTPKNGPKVCEVISHLCKLESLSIQSSYNGSLCLGGNFSAPTNLQSLKLEGRIHVLPEWISKLQNLVKLKLNLELSSQSERDTVIQELGNLPSLSILCLQGWSSSTKRSANGGEHLFQCGTFKRLRMLELIRLDATNSVEFELGAMTQLEQLKYWDFGSNEVRFYGLEFLPSIKKVVVDYEYTQKAGDQESDSEVVAEFEAQFRGQIASNTNAHKIVLQLDVRVVAPKLTADHDTAQYTM